MISRARGSLLGQLSGDALGGLVEFQSPGEIFAKYPDGVRELADGGTWNTIAGQPTDDSEMALMLARMLADRGEYDAEAARHAYVYWIDSGPFDCGMTTTAGLRGRPNHESQANGALMRISPLGIFGANHDPARVAEWAERDASITHPHPVCLQANALFAMAIAHAVRTGSGPDELYRRIIEWSGERKIDSSLTEIITTAATEPPLDYIRQQGWVLVAFHNALWQLLHSENVEDGVVDTVMRGGDTDTNAAICGALLGAVYGEESIPSQWTDALLTCRPADSDPRVRHPRPECFWPVDALDLAEQLLRTD